MSILPTNVQADIAFTDRDFASVSKIAKARYGLSLEPSKKAMIRSRLLKRLTALGLNDFQEYCAAVEADTGPESDNFISALTTNVTHFYREKHHFDTFEAELMPTLAERLKKGGRVRIWSAGCSSGQEPYSLAGSVLEVLPDAARYDLRILATDVDPVILAKAQAASYHLADARFPSDAYRKRIFGSVGAAADSAEVRPELRALTTFRRLNLYDDWPFSGKFDMIMCRNVAIYFDRETQSKLWARMTRYLTPDGYLFIGHSERVQGPAMDQLATVGITTYQRQGATLSGAKG